MRARRLAKTMKLAVIFNFLLNIMPSGFFKFLAGILDKISDVNF